MNHYLIGIQKSSLLDPLPLLQPPLPDDDDSDFLPPPLRTPLVLDPPALSSSGGKCSNRTWSFLRSRFNPYLSDGGRRPAVELAKCPAPMDAILRKVMIPASSRNSGGGGSRNDAKPSMASTASQVRRSEISESLLLFHGRTVTKTAKASECVRPCDRSSGRAIAVAAGGASSNNSRTTLPLPLILPTAPDLEER